MPTFDMSELVTRAILKHELEIFEQKVDEKLQPIREELDRKANKSDLDLMLGAILDRIAQSEQRLDARFATFRTLIEGDTQRAVGFAVDQFRRELTLALEPTNNVAERVTSLEQLDLPVRVTKLEAKVFPPKRARRR